MWTPSGAPCAGSLRVTGCARQSRSSIKSPRGPVEKPGVERSAPPSFKAKRPTVGLDTPCRKCGRPIYYNYKGPVEGLCGRCTDGTRKTAFRFKSSRRIGFFRSKRGRGWITLFLVAMACFAAAAYLYFTGS